MEVYLLGTRPSPISISTESLTASSLTEKLVQILGTSSNSFYLISNGRRVTSEILQCQKIYVVPTVLGGKGGFGSMLRAIGAQIEKTTNREACRDLSGRRLRDINEEQRLKNWITTQAEREKEAALRKRKKLEKLCEEPKHEFNDETYEKERSILPEIVEDAVEQGLKAACSSQKRKVEETKPTTSKNKKKKLWVDDGLESDVSLSEDEETSQKPQTQESQLCKQTSS